MSYCILIFSLPHYATTHPHMQRIVRSAKQRDATLRKSRRSFWRGREGVRGGGRQCSLRIKEQQRGTATSSSSFPPYALFKLSMTNCGSRALIPALLARAAADPPLSVSVPARDRPQLSQRLPDTLERRSDLPRHAYLPAYRHLLHHVSTISRRD